MVILLTWKSVCIKKVGLILWVFYLHTDTVMEPIKLEKLQESAQMMKTLPFLIEILTNILNIL